LFYPEKIEKNRPTLGHIHQQSWIYLKKLLIRQYPISYTH
jgi:hypothetical protein